MIRPIALLVALTALAGCIAPTGEDAEDVTGTDPLMMPSPIVQFEAQHDWGNHHLQWHSERRWDRMSSSDRAWCQKQGWKRAALQEGAKGNGLEFLAMHRAMIHILTKQFPKQKALFAGWSKVPTDPRDKIAPLPHGDRTAFDATMLKALDRLEHHLDSFADDDELGRYIETKMAPLPGKPDHRTSDPSAGLHNYLHMRFMDPESAIDIGDPSVNLQNKRFWQLHGWLDARWTAFRKLKGVADSDPVYKKALDTATTELTMLHKGGPVKGGPGMGPPQSLLDFLASGE
jgi:hypothetical protein